jgi:hypothetical protein
MSSVDVRESVDGRAAQVRRLLDSRTFHNTEVLKRLLDYLARQVLENHAGDLKEYTIGVEAFGKPVDYDPQTDSSVRVQIGKLRQKLDEYYRLEGRQDEILIELPKGHFKLEFRQRVEDAAVRTLAPVAAMPKRSLGLPFWAAVAVAALALAYAFRPVTGSGPWTSPVQEFWRPFVTSPRPIMVSIGAPMFVKIGNDFFRDPALNAWDAASQPAQLQDVERAIGASAARRRARSNCSDYCCRAAGNSACGRAISLPGRISADTT